MRLVRAIEPVDLDESIASIGSGRYKVGASESDISSSLDCSVSGIYTGDNWRLTVSVKIFNGISNGGSN